MKDQAHAQKADQLSAAKTVASRQAEDEAVFVDNRPQVHMHRAMADMVNNSPRMVAQRKLQQMADNSLRVMQQQAVADMANKTPRLVAQRRGAQEAHASQAAPNNTGLPDQLKSGIESLSGMSMDGVKVHYNSSQPAQLNALAYAQSSDIYVGPGQEKHLPHEAWHVVQQKQGRVRPTFQMKGGVSVNDDAGLEHEADVMGGRALTEPDAGVARRMADVAPGTPPDSPRRVVQRELTSFKDVEVAANNKKFAWADFRTRMNNHDYAKVGKASGLGAETKNENELITTIKWLPVHPNAKEGTGVDVTVLGPDHKLGSEPQAGAGKIWNQRRIQLAAESKGKYIAGHLLNNNLGGPGDDARNLTALPATANAQQSRKIEEEVKSLVNEQHYFVHYQVNVTYAKDDAGKKLWYASKLISKWNALDKDGRDIGPSKQINIMIPAPSALSGGEVTSSDDATIVDTSAAAKAAVDPVREVILNNSGYLAVAVKVQAVFRAAIMDLRVRLQAAKLFKKEEHEVLLTNIDILTEELDETKELLKDTEQELAQKTALLEASELEESALRIAMKVLDEEFKEMEAEVGELKQELTVTKQENMVLRIQVAAFSDFFVLSEASEEVRRDDDAPFLLANISALREIERQKSAPAMEAFNKAKAAREPPDDDSDSD